jgi:hypothetical protein
MDPLSTSFLFSQFLDQRRYLKNVTPSTIEWYETAFKALQRAHATLDPALTKTPLAPQHKSARSSLGRVHLAHCCKYLATTSRQPQLRPSTESRPERSS